MNSQIQPVVATSEKISIELVSGEVIDNGKGFKALSFREKAFNGLMDPLVMVDHFTMTHPTFGTHPHAGISAVTVLFEDSVGDFHNRDSLGNNIDLQAGDLYWLKAGRGAVHDEAPRSGARTHGLQLFVNLPAHLKHSQPASQYLKASDIPVIESNGARVRVVLGSSDRVSGAQSLSSSLTILDATLKSGANWAHVPAEEENVWVHSVSGDIEINFGRHHFQVSDQQAIALHGKDLKGSLQFYSKEGAQFVLISGIPIEEKFIQQGPFVMSTQQELDQVQRAYLAGRLGSID